MKLLRSVICALTCIISVSHAQTTVFQHQEGGIPTSEVVSSTITKTIEQKKVPVDYSAPTAAAVSGIGSSFATFATNSMQAGFAVATFLGLGYSSYQIYKIFKNWWYEKHKTAKIDPYYESNEELCVKAFLGLVSATGTTILANVNWADAAKPTPYKNVVQNTTTKTSDVKRGF